MIELVGAADGWMDWNDWKHDRCDGKMFFLKTYMMNKWFENGEMLEWSNMSEWKKPLDEWLNSHEIS